MIYTNLACANNYVKATARMQPASVFANLETTHRMSLIYKIFRSDEYDAFRAKGATNGAPVDLQDGFIHFSTAAQLAETARRHFAGEDGLWVVAVQTQALGAALKWEPSRGGDLFPHLYRELRSEDVEFQREVIGADGFLEAIGAVGTGKGQT